MSQTIDSLFSAPPMGSVPSTPADIPPAQTSGAPALLAPGEIADGLTADRLDRPQVMRFDPRQELDPQVLEERNAQTREVMDAVIEQRGTGDVQPTQAGQASASDAAKGTEQAQEASGTGPVRLRLDRAASDPAAHLDDAPIEGTDQTLSLSKEDLDFLRQIEDETKTGRILNEEQAASFANARWEAKQELGAGASDIACEIRAAEKKMAVLDARNAELEASLSKLEDEDCLTGKFNSVIDSSIMVGVRKQSLNLLMDRLQTLQDMAEARGDVRERMAAIFSTVQTIGRFNRAHTALLAGANDDPLSVLDRMETGMSMVGEEAAIFEKHACKAVADLLALAFPDSGLDKATLAAIVSHALRADIAAEELIDVLQQAATAARDLQKELQGFGVDKGTLTAMFALGKSEDIDVQALLETIFSAPGWQAALPEASAPKDAKAAYHADLVRVLAAGLWETSSSSGPSREQAVMRMAYVDMLFQKTYPESSEAALALKRMILPQSLWADIEVQHTFVLSSRVLVSDLLGQIHPKGIDRKAAVGRMASASVSQHSFLLTPELVGTLSAKVKIADFNYHLAHVALLQKRCLDAGLIPGLPPSSAKDGGDVEAWCRGLGLDGEASAYAADVSRKMDSEDGDRYTLALTEAAADFTRGLHGATETDKAGQIIRKASRLTSGLLASRREKNLYQTSPDYLARRLLDGYAISLGGLIGTERFSDDEGMGLDGAKFDDALRERTVKFLTESGLAETDALVRERNEVRSELSAGKAKLRLSVERMRTFARTADEYLALRQEKMENVATRQEMEFNRSLIRFSWPHQRSERRRVARDVLEVGDLLKEKDALVAKGLKAGDLLYDSLQARIDRGLAQLDGVAPFKLVYTGGGEKMTEKMLREHLLPRAQAVDFFQIRKEHNGRMVTDAKRLRSHVRGLGAKLKLKNMALDRRMNDLISRMGLDDALRLQQTIRAAVLKTYVESQTSPAGFDINDPGTQEKLYAQLSRWGMEAKAHPLVSSLVRLACASLTTPAGGLDTHALARLFKYSSPMDLDGRDALEEKFKDKAARKNYLRNEMLSDERRRMEGIRSLMRQASLPGSGFVYDHGKGVLIDTGSIFSPFSGRNDLLSTANLSCPLSARFKAMHSNSLTVSNMGEGRYQVMLKGKGLLGVGGKLALSPGVDKLTLAGELGYDHNSEHGLVLTFASREDCEAFLNDFMRPTSSLHSAGSVGKGESWRKASQIEFLDAKGNAVNFGLTLMVSMFKKHLVATTAATGTRAFSMSAKPAEIKRSVTQNAMGETTTFSYSFSATLGTAMTFGVAGSIPTGQPEQAAAPQEDKSYLDSVVDSMQPKVLVGSPHVGTRKGLHVDIDERFKIVTDEKGLSAKTCMETECGKGLLDWKGFRHLLPSDVMHKIKEDVEFSDSMERMFKALPPTARLVIERPIREEILQKVRGLMTDARTAAPKEKEALLDKAHALLARPSSYRPTQIKVRYSVTEAPGKHEWQPGFLVVKYLSSTSLTRFGSSKALSIVLPGSERETAPAGETPSAPKPADIDARGSSRPAGDILMETPNGDAAMLRGNAISPDDIRLGGIFRQNTNTCFMLSVLNSLMATEAGLQRAKDLFRTPGMLTLPGGATLSLSPDEEGYDARFSPLENALARAYRAAARGEENFRLGSQGFAESIADVLGLFPPDGQEVGRALDAAAQDADKRSFMEAIGRSLARQEQVILFQGRMGAVSGGHYMAVVGTYGDPAAGGDYGLVVHDSLTGTRRQFSVADLTVPQGGVVQAQFFTA